MKLILLTDPKPIEGELSFLQKLFKAGLTDLHVRKPGYSYETLKTYIASFPSHHFDKLVLHQHYDLAHQYQLKGIHFADQPNFNSPFPKKGLFFSKAIHQLAKLSQIHSEMDRLLLSPVFNSISKESHPANFALEEVQEYMKTHTFDFEVIALGGIDANNIHLPEQIGFDGVAVLGGVWEVFKAEGELQALKVFKDMMRKIG